MTNAAPPQLQPKSTADALRDAHASFLGPAYDRSIFLEAAAEIASLKADNEQLRKALRSIYAVDTGKMGVHGAICEMQRIARDSGALARPEK